MSEDTEVLIPALLAKRAELADKLTQLQTTIFHIDATLQAFGYLPGRKQLRRFANGELIALIGEAERAGTTTANAIARWVVANKGWDPEDRQLAKRVLFSVKDCRKRMNARQ